MGHQNEIINSKNLFNDDGSLHQKGWMKKPILTYNKESIGKKWYRIKEWDHYSVLNDEIGFQLTIGDIGYLTQMSYALIDFTKKEKEVVGTFKFFTKSKILPLSSTEDSVIDFPTKKFIARITKSGNERILELNDKKFQKMGIKAKITLFDDPKMDNTVLATGYKEDKRLFYYNHKNNFMRAKGSIEVGNDNYPIEPENTFGLMDWGRGIWPYRTHWLWGSACGMVNRVPMAFNIGYGFGDLSTHTENIVFYNGKAHKLDEVTFHHENRDPTKPWQFTSNDDRLKLTLKPIVPESSKLNFGLITMNSSLLHGYYSGKVVLDNGETVKIEKMLGHAEDILWKW